MNAMRLVGRILGVSSDLLARKEMGGGVRPSPFFWDFIALATGPADAYKTLGRNLCKEVTLWVRHVFLARLCIVVMGMTQANWAHGLEIYQSKSIQIMSLSMMTSLVLTLMTLMTGPSLFSIVEH